MKYLWIFALVAIYSLLGIGAAAEDAPFFFVQISDTQMGFTNNNADMVPEIVNFKQAVAVINRLQPAFVLLTGDAINRPHHTTQIRAFWTIVGGISRSIPFRIVAGNHDVSRGTARDVDSYRRFFGDDHYSFMHNGSDFIVLNSGLFSKDADKALRDEQRKWFEAELSSTRARNASHIFVCAHHPWFLKTPDEADRYENVPLAYRQDYLDLMKRHKVEYALAGHLHYDLTVKHGDLTIVAGGPLSKSVAEPPVVGLRIWRVYKDRIDTQFYALDKVPASVKL